MYKYINLIYLVSLHLSRCQLEREFMREGMVELEKFQEAHRTMAQFQKLLINFKVSNS